MSKTFVEALLLASVATNAALLLFFAGVFRKMMNAVDEASFKQLMELLIRYSTKSPFMISVLNLPFVIAVPYYFYFGFGNWFITAGLILWLISGSVSKMLKLPVYKTISTLNSDATAALAEARRKVNAGNLFQAILYCMALIVMLFGWK